MFSDLRASEVQLLELQREREATKTVYDSMLAKLMQTGLQQTLNFAQFRILLDATVPKAPETTAGVYLAWWGDLWACSRSLCRIRGSYYRAAL